MALVMAWSDRRGRDSSVSRATGWTAGIRFPAWSRFSLLHNVQLNGYRGTVSLEVKRPGLEADYSPPPSAEVKSDGAVPPLPYKYSWRGS
jgi:hypothetical protein